MPGDALATSRPADARNGAAPRRSALRVSFKARVLVGIFVLAGVLSLGLTWVLHDLLTSMSLQIVATATSAAAVQMSGRIDAASVAATQGSATARDALRARLESMRALILREFPPWWLGDPALCARRVMIVVPAGAVDSPRILVSTDARGEGEPYDFGPAPIPDVDWPKWKWQAMTTTEQFLATPRGVVLAGRSPIRDPSGVPVGAIVIESDEAFVAASRGPLLWFVQAVFACTMLAALAVSMVLAMRAGKPVSRLAEGMERLARGELGTTIPQGRRGDEFDVLVERFNAMSMGLKDRESMRRSLADASEVQRQLLPAALPEIDGYESLHEVQYCEQTGGDYVDVLPVNADSGHALWGLALGDVAGHGIAAAMLMSWTRAMIRVLAAVHGPDVRAIVREVNTHLRRDIADGTFLTLFLGVLDPRTHRLTWTSAGHDPVLLVHANGRVDRLGSTDAPVGVLDGAEFAAGETVTLERGDLLLVSSDGLTQTRDAAGRYFGFDRVEQILIALRARPLREIREALVREATRHRGTEIQDDDITFLLVRRAAQPPSAVRADRP